MLQAHSFLWHYLWIAPNLLNLGLAVLLWRRGLLRQYRFFFSYLIFIAIKEFALYALDLSPTVSGETWWRFFWVGTIAEGLLKFGVISELLHQLLHSWPALARTGRALVGGAGALLVLLAAVLAGLRQPGNGEWLISGSHTLMQTIYITEAGLILSIFLLAWYFNMPWERLTFGIAFGFGVTWCEHLATWALLATDALPLRRELLDFANMATFHVAVLIWFYYLLVPQKLVAKPAVALPENNLAVWNRELERLLQS